MQADIYANNASGIGYSVGSMHERAAFKRLVVDQHKQISYCEYGAAQGHPVLYFHDVGSSRLESKLLAKAAGEAGLRIIAVDRPGVGSSKGFDEGLQDYFIGLDALIAHLRLGRYSLITSGAAFGIGLAFTRDRKAGLHSFTALSPRQDSLLSLFKAVPRPLRGLARVLLQSFMRIRYRQFTQAPDEYFERHCDCLCALDSNSVHRSWVRDAILSNVHESLRNGTCALEWDIANACEPAVSPIKDMSRFYAWCGTKDNAGLTLEKSYDFESKRFVGSGRYFFLRHIGEITHAIRQDLLSALPQPTEAVLSQRCSASSTQSSLNLRPSRQSA